MDIFEITGYRTGVSNEGVNFLDPADAFDNLIDGYIYRQVLQSRKGFTQFGNRLSDGSRVMGIFEFILTDSTKETLICSKDFLYRFNAGTNQFDQIPMNSSVPIGTFGITDNIDYVSGTAYPDKNGNQRFVFSSRGMSDVFFYNGTDVKRFTNLADNPDYAPPPEGAITNSLHVIAFNGKLNLVSPLVGAITYSRSVFYTADPDSSGKGDKFNVPGAGNIGARTGETISGAAILGNIMTLHFTRSQWALEITTDTFNPYFIRKIPSVLGTNAPFSAVSWYDQVQSVGKTGIIATDGRESLRTDNKVPYFTNDEIDAVNFELIYGGFNRNTSQFLFSYLSVDNEIGLTSQNAVLVNNYEENTWSVYNQRFSCFGQSTLGLNLTWDDIYEVNNPTWATWDTTEEIWDRIGIGSEVQKTLAGDDYGFVYELDTDFNDYASGITGIVQGGTTTININAAAFEVNDRISILNVQGMTEINDDERDEDVWPIVLSKTLTSITINIDSSDFSAWTSGGIVSKIIDFEAVMVPFNPYRSQGRKCYVSHVEFLINTDSKEGLLVDVYDDEEESPFIKSVPLTPVAIPRERQWIAMSVNQEANFLTFVLNHESSTDQVKITSIRIHCSPGAFTTP